jgi:hypothetical protein
MAQYFNINSNSTNPTLRVELVDDGKYDFFTSHIFNSMLESSDITFTMWDEHDVLKISKAPCNIFISETSGCEPRYIIEYQWQPKDTRKKGTFKGRFEIPEFGDVTEKGQDFPEGNLILPIYEDLIISIK